MKTQINPFASLGSTMLQNKAGGEHSQDSLKTEPIILRIAGPELQMCQGNVFPICPLLINIGASGQFTQILV